MNDIELYVLENEVVKTLKKLPQDRQLAVYQKCMSKRIRGLYAEHRMIQVINHSNLPGICGNEDWCDTIGNTKVIVEYKFDNGKNTLQKFIKTGQFERDYKWKVDENFSRQVIVVFALHKSNRFDVKNEELIINGIYTKSNLSDKEGKWIFELDGKTLKDLCNYIESGSFYKDTINIKNAKFLYGEMQHSIDLGIRQQKVFWEATKNNGEKYWYSKASNEAKLVLPDDLRKDTSNIIPMTLDELYFDLYKLSFDCKHQNDNRKKQFYICIKIDDTWHILRYNKYCTFLPQDFEDKTTFVNKLLKVLNIHFSDKIKKGFVYYD